MIMPKHTLYTAIIVLATFILCCSVAQAHKIRVFAYAGDGKITAEASFSSGRPAKNSQVTVYNGNGDTLLTGTTNDKGLFRFAIPQQAKATGMDLNIVVDVGEGHRGSWLLNASDYGAADYGGAQSADSAGGSSAKHSYNGENSGESSGEGSSAAPPATPSGNNPNCQDIEAAVETIITKELVPLKRMIAQQRVHQTSLQDIIGGLGYILGLAGILFYFKAKKHTSSNTGENT